MPAMILSAQYGLKISNLGVHTLAGIDLSITAGQCAGLIGPSGAGKSLFLRALADLDPHEGSVWLDGVQADQIPAPHWRRQVALLPAESVWWHDTVGPHFDNPPDAGLKELGFDSDVLSWKISRLSSGERQRLAVLRLLALQPKVLLLDEPTANLDRINTQRVESLLNGYRRSRNPVVIWVSHDIEQLRRNCDPILMVDGRRIRLLDRATHGLEGRPS
jgi:ABC-type iron transport system FetAB ATPase subunit